MTTALLTLGLLYGTVRLLRSIVALLSDALRLLEQWRRLRAPDRPLFPTAFPEESKLDGVQVSQKENPPISGGFLDGRTWDRTRDLSRVKRALSR
jgi:hypothetical protein